MSTTIATTTITHDSTATHQVPLRLEAVVVPVADYDRARDFYIGLNWRVDADVDDGNGYRLMQLTPPGSEASVILGTRVTSAAPGSLDGLLLVVDDIEQARAALASQGVTVSEAFHDAGGGLGGGFHPGDEGRAPGADPERRSYATYASFYDSEGNRWVLQQITTRLPGRLWDADAAGVSALAALLHETAQHHDAFEKAAPQHSWWDWYAPYLSARQRGLTVEEATTAADQHMLERHNIAAARG